MAIPYAQLDPAEIVAAQENALMRIRAGIDEAPEGWVDPDSVTVDEADEAEPTDQEPKAEAEVEAEVTAAATVAADPEPDAA